MSKPVLHVIPQNNFTEQDQFFIDAQQKMKKEGYDKAVILLLKTNPEDNYEHAFSSLNMTSTQTIALLEITKSVVIEQMS